MSAKVSFGESRGRACDALNAASSVMKNAKTSSTQIAYNVSHTPQYCTQVVGKHMIFISPPITILHMYYIAFFEKIEGSLTANSTKKGKPNFWDVKKIT